MYILVVEDDQRLSRLLARALTEAGHRVEVESDGSNGLQRAETGVYDLVLLDVMLPEMNGLEVCRYLREQHVLTPILMLTARDAISDRVQGLDAGADDYLTKPFALEELLARVRALSRRAKSGAEDDNQRVGDLVLDPTHREVRRGESLIELTAKEFSLLEYLMRHAGRVVTKAQITDHVWGYDSDASSNVVEIYVHYLRNKIDKGFGRPLIRTVRGVGYVIKE
ncbi:MAG: response regulator transcription factor [Dehalococcoidia bacterium]|nr:response regulator transcription factor [Dehalococcoidia bacterium]